MSEYMTMYPRPDKYRSEWLCLDGKWEFEFDEKNIGEKGKWFLNKAFTNTINVPFVYQSELSGINISKDVEVVWYKKKFMLDQINVQKDVQINFGGVDYLCKIWVNSQYIGQHKGGVSSFDFNITNFLSDSGENEICVRVEDAPYDKSKPRGKQSWLEKNKFGCWYDRHTGIWQSVWIDFVNPQHLKHFQICPNILEKSVEFELFFSEILSPLELKIDISFKDIVICSNTYSLNQNSFKTIIDVNNNHFSIGIKTWSPESPDLYDVTFTLINDDTQVDLVKSYFGMRSIETKNGKVLLNGYPYYQKLLLFQAYYDKGFITADNEDIFKRDIENIKNMGFNGIRIHQKIEDPRFLYYCDKMGLLVWEEMPSAYHFDINTIESITEEFIDIIKRDINHPCIITWVMLNESWGVPAIKSNVQQQAFSESLYYLAKAIDKSRLVIANDGWEHTKTDLCTIHDYPQDGTNFDKYYSNLEKLVVDSPMALRSRFIFAEGYSYSGQPVLITEFGGISFKSDDGWGYNSGATDHSDFYSRYQSFINSIKNIDFIVGYCYTQYTDIQQEKNGLLKIDREFKVDPDMIKQINTD